MAKQETGRVQDHSEHGAVPMTDRDRDRVDPAAGMGESGDTPSDPERSPGGRGPGGKRAPRRINLSREDMENTIKAGGSVIWRGEHFTKVEELPSQEELAEGDENTLTDLEASLARQEADIQTRRRALSERQSKAKAESKAHAKDDKADRSEAEKKY